MPENTPVETVPAPRLNPEPGSTVPNPPGSATDLTVAQPTATPVPPGDAVAGYELTHEIARGGMGVVYAATDLAFGRTVAVKTALPGTSADAFVREAEITARLAHPGIPPVHARGTLPDGRPYLAMKLIRGETLQRAIESGTDRARLVATFEQICHAVGYAHAQGVVHRDLKPANVMVGAFGEVLVMDWGLAKEAPGAEGGTGATTVPTAPHSEATLHGSAKGTPAYMPPEQARGEWATVGARSDVFALGGILCALLTGQPPFAGASASAALDRAKRADVSGALGLLDASGADADLIALCKVCLAARPEDRYADGTAVAQAVSAYRAGVEERTRRAERDRAAAEARAAEEANTRREAEARADAERAARAEAEARASAEANTRREQRKRSRAQLLLACAAAVLVAAGGAFAWYSADRKATEAQLEGDKKASDTRANTEAEFKEKQARQGIDANLTLAANLRKVYNFAEADRLLVQALEFAKSGAPDRVAEVERAREGLAFVRKLDGIRFRKWLFLAEAEGKGKFNTQIASPEYRAAFAEFGLDLTALAPTDAAAHIGASAVKADLVAAVDDWALYEPNNVLARRLLEVAGRADPGPWRDRLRDPKVRADKAALEQLAADANVAGTTLAALSVLAELMGRAKADPVAVLVAARARYPADFELAFALGQVSASPGDIGPYEAARALRPDNASVWNNLGGALASAGDARGAVAALTKALEFSPNDARVLANLGNALRASGDTPKAVAALNRAIELEPKYAKAHFNLGVVLRDTKNPAGAVAAFERVIALDPTDAGGYSGLGESRLLKGDLAGAIAAYERAIELDPESARAHSNLGNAKLAKKDFAGAIAAHNRAVELEPKNARVQSNLGLALSAKGDRDGAVAAFERALELEPKLPHAWFNLGNALRAKRDVPGAVAAFRRAIAIDPKFAAAYAELGTALRDRNDTVGAIEAYARAAELDENLPTVHFNLGVTLALKGEVARAATAFEQAVRVDPNDFESHTNFGAMYIDLKRFADAATSARAAIKLAPRFANAYGVLGLALQRQGDIPGARAALSDAARLDKGWGAFLAKLPPVAVAPAPREKP